MDIRDINQDLFFDLKDFHNKVKFLLKYAILAPSTHNSQPWLFKITANSCKVYFDQSLLIPEADPKSRDLYISIGCAVENFIIAAKYFNMFSGISYGPFNETKLLAEIYLKDSNHTTDKNFERLLLTIPKRITARGIFKKEAVENEIIKEIYNNIKDEYLNDINVEFVEDFNRINKIAELTAEGLKMAYKRPSFRKEMSSWMNHSLSRKKQGLHGYALKMPFWLSFIIPPLVRFKDIGEFLAGLNYKSIVSAPLITVLLSNENSYLTWLKIGRTAERLMLEFNSRGLNNSIFVASIEMGELYKELQKLLDTNKQPQFLFVTGKIEKIHKPTPRHHLETKIIE